MKWTPEGGWPDRRHAAAVARLFREARERARLEAEKLWNELHDGGEDDE